MTRTQGLEWGDMAQNDFHLWFEGGTLKTDATFSPVGGVAPTDPLVMTQAVSKIIAGATSFSIMNNAGTNANLLITDAGNATLRGSLAFSAAASTIVPGATSLKITNSAGTNNNVVITDAGQVAITSGNNTNASTASLYTYDGAALPNDANSYFSVMIQGANAGAGNQLTNTKRALWVTNTLTGAFNQGTYAAVYGQSSMGGTGYVVHHIGVVGAADFTGSATYNATAISAGVYSFLQVTSGTPGIGIGVNYWGAGYGSTGLTADRLAGVWIQPIVCAGNTITDAYGSHFEMPTGASGNNMGVQIGTRFTATATVGLHVGSAGAWFRGSATVPPADTANITSNVFIWAGSNTGANDTLCALYFYRSSVNQGFIGFDGTVAAVNAGHTKLVSDMIIGNTKLLVDTNGQVYGQNSIRATTGLWNVESVLASGNLPTGLTIQNAAHTGLTVAAARQVYFNLGNALASFGAGGGTAATMDGLLVGAPQYSAAAAMTITKASTVRISGIPSVSASAGFAPTLTTAYALSVDAGASFFGGSVIQSHAPQAINSTNTATAAQAASGYITSTSAAPTSITFPTGTALGAAIGAVQGTVVYLTIDNTAGANTVTVVVNTNAILSALAVAVGASAGLLTIPSGVTGTGTFQLTFTSATAYTITRVA